MDTNLKEYLQRTFYRDNHPKYHKYFELWVNNLTEAQIYAAKLWYYWEHSHNLKVKNELGKPKCGINYK